MKKQIPTYPLLTLSNDQRVDQQGLFLIDHIPVASQPLDIPHRTGYYGIGLCIKGEARITANLEMYTIVPGSLILLSPHIIKQWHHQSKNFQTIAVLFTDSYFNPTDNKIKGKFLYFQDIARNIIPLSKQQAAQVQSTLQFIHEKHAIDYKDKDAIAKQLIQAMLFEVAYLQNRTSCLNS